MSEKKKVLLSIDLDTANEIKRISKLNMRSFTGQINFILNTFVNSLK